MADGDEESIHLDNEFDQCLQRIENFMTAYKYREKFLAKEWLKKLKKSHNNVEERKLRNRFIRHFLNNHGKDYNVFTSGPFQNLPKDFTGPLSDLKYLLVLLQHFTFSN